MKPVPPATGQSINQQYIEGGCFAGNREIDDEGVPMVRAVYRNDKAVKVGRVEFFEEFVDFRNLLFLRLWRAWGNGLVFALEM